MSNINKLSDRLRCSTLLSPRNLLTLGTLRSCSGHSKLPKKFDDSHISEKNEDVLTYKDPASVQTTITSYYWNEEKAVKRLRKKNTFPRNVNHLIDLSNGLVSIRQNFPSTLQGIAFWLKKLREKRELIEQKFMPERHAILKPDLAAAHFLFRRGGAFKFVGQSHWVSANEKKVVLPPTFAPGFYIEAIKLENSNLFYEGLQNICDLKFLKSLSLKNLEHVNDWWLDWISTEYYLNLKHLDLTNCKNVTYRGLSCFYRFESLETLNLEGISDSPEFKLACLKLQDIMPELNLTGVDLSLPEEIKAVAIKQDNMPPKENAVQEL